MGFNFPDTPSDGATFSPISGLDYVFSGGAWLQQSPLTSSTPITGATFFNSKAQAMASPIAADVPSIILHGYATPGDGGGAMYKRVIGEPTHLGKFQSADGAWWELTAFDYVTLEMFSGKADATGTMGSGLLMGEPSGTDNLPAMKAALGYKRFLADNVYGYSPQIRLGSGRYYFSGMIVVDHHVRITGAGGWATANSTTNSTFWFNSNTRAFYFKAGDEVDPETGIANSYDAGGSVLEYVKIEAPWHGSLTDKTKHGIFTKTRVRIDSCMIYAFGGNGVHILANAPGIGNANGFELRGLRIRFCENGVYVDGEDANGGTGYNIDVDANRAWGINDSGYFGSTWTGCMAHTNGLDGNTHYAGNLYYCKNAALSGTTTPGTNDAVWGLYGAGAVSAFFPEYVPGHTYTVGGSYAADNANAGAAFVGCYMENDQALPSVRAPSIIFGGSMNYNQSDGLKIHSSGSAGKWVAGQRNAIAGQVGSIVSLAHDANHGIHVVHSDDPSTGFAPVLWEAGNYVTRYAGSVSSTPIRYTATGNLLSGGRVSPIPAGNIVLAQGMWIGGAVITARQFTTVQSIPTVGEFAKGDIYINVSLVAGGKIGWVCTTAGVLAAAWVSGTTYLAGFGFILTGAGRYYKCMAKALGTTTSVNAPVHTTGEVLEADGYTWLYLGTVAAVLKPWGAIDA